MAGVVLLRCRAAWFQTSTHTVCCLNPFKAQWLLCLPPCVMPAPCMYGLHMIS